MVHIAKDHKRVRRHDEEHMIRTACAMLVAALVFSAAHAENCTPPADDYRDTFFRRLMPATGKKRGQVL
jgi:hypothetical protein